MDWIVAAEAADIEGRRVYVGNLSGGRNGVVMVDRETGDVTGAHDGDPTTIKKVLEDSRLIKSYAISGGAGLFAPIEWVDALYEMRSESSGTVLAYLKLTSADEWEIFIVKPDLYCAVVTCDLVDAKALAESMYAAKGVARA